VGEQQRLFDWDDFLVREFTRNACTLYEDDHIVRYAADPKMFAMWSTPERLERIAKVHRKAVVINGVPVHCSFQG